MAVEKLRIEEKIEKVEKFPWKDFIHLQPHGFKYMTPAQLEKLIGKDVVASFCHKPEGDIMVAPSADKRTAVAISAKDDFPRKD